MHDTPTASTPKKQPKSYSQDDLPDEVKLALAAAIDKSARAPVLLNVTDITGYTDWVLIVSGRSERQVGAIAEGVRTALRERGIKPRGIDGFDEHSWDLLDYDDFIVHVFYHPVRTHFDLESMWSDAARVKLDLPDEVTDTSELDNLDAPAKLPEYRGDLVFGGFDDEFEDDDDHAADLAADLDDDDLDDD